VAPLIRNGSFGEAFFQLLDAGLMLGPGMDLGHLVPVAAGGN